MHGGRGFRVRVMARVSVRVIYRQVLKQLTIVED
jgi:hypothetical protein